LGWWGGSDRAAESRWAFKRGAGDEWVDWNGDRVGGRWPRFSGRGLVLECRRMSMFVFIVSNALPKTRSACEYNARHFEDGYVVEWYFFWLTGALDLKEVEE